MDSIMKKTAFIIGLISLLTACNSGSDDRFMELPDTPAGKASISFDGARTRASLNTISSTFALYGIATDAGNTSVVFNNQKIEYNNESTLWVYSPLKYWNTQADHKFGAYAPYNSSRNFSFNPEGFPMITGFMVSQNVDNQESLLLSHPVDREVRAGGLDMSPVVFTFDPALTRINFRIKKESSLTASDLPTTPGMSLETASTIAIAGISPPVSTKSPIEISRSTFFSTNLSSTPS